jgi:hypothetical protein
MWTGDRLVDLACALLNARAGEHLAQVATGRVRIQVHRVPGHHCTQQQGIGLGQGRCWPCLLWSHSARHGASHARMCLPLHEPGQAIG